MELNVHTNLLFFVGRSKNFLSARKFDLDLVVADEGEASFVELQLGFRSGFQSKPVEKLCRAHFDLGKGESGADAVPISTAEWPKRERLDLIAIFFQEPF